MASHSLVRNKKAGPQNRLAALHCPPRPMICRGQFLARLVSPLLLALSVAPAHGFAAPRDGQPAQAVNQTSAPAAISPADSRAVAPTSASAAPTSASALPDEPKPNSDKPALKSPPTPCDLKNAGASMGSTAVVRAIAALNATNLQSLPRPAIVDLVVCVPHAPAIVNWYARFLTGPEVKPLTPIEKGAPGCAKPHRSIQLAHHRR